MSELTDEQRERMGRVSLAGVDENTPGLEGAAKFLLRLLDAERARADAAEAKVARVRGYTEMSAVAAHAVGNGSEERTLLDLLHLLDLKLNK